MITITPDALSKSDLANSAYHYYVLQVSGIHTFSGAFERTIFCYSGNFSVEGLILSPNDSIEITNREMVLSGSGILLVAEGNSVDLSQKAKITRDGAHYKVIKPWGYELWINGEHPRICFKKIFISANTQTSLQYHNFKEETNLIIEGEAILVSKKSECTLENDFVASEHLQNQTLVAPTAIHVLPKTLHRLIAVTNILLFEVSTPFLDDVIRIQDDTLRNNGRVESEHTK